MARIRDIGSNRISQKDLAQIIDLYTADDPRTIRKWTQALINFKFIRTTVIPNIYDIEESNFLEQVRA